MNYVSNFVRHGDPNIDTGRVKNSFTDAFGINANLPNWPEYSTANPWGYQKMSTSTENYAEWTEKPVVTSRDGSEVLVDQTVVCDMFDGFDEYGDH